MRAIALAFAMATVSTLVEPTLMAPGANAFVIAGGGFTTFTSSAVDEADA
ncbi:MAG: hypothetical protein IPJ28_18440 [Betaproteobacteria bacterium]|nr:hypothetical protein [Betaproteobacteria bacterium]